jgi:hypothetical protein
MNRQRPAQPLCNTEPLEAPSILAECFRQQTVFWPRIIATTSSEKLERR